ncbi:adaptin N terminal region-domain-containing protein [Syncephalis fuscata]|nr:adaptin N terminal region-domain-containing protein [Syncephalis fuscata]
MNVGSFSSFFLPSKVLNNTARATGISSIRVADGGSLRLTQFLKRLTQCESRRVERSIVQTELQHVQKEFAQDDSVVCLRDGLLRVTYCQLLGYSVDAFASYVAALVQRSDCIADKRIGYTLAALLLNDGSEFALMLVNAMLKDLQSREDNFVIFTLTALTHLMNTDIATATTPSVIKLLVHPSEAVRRRVIVVLECVERCSPDMLVPYRDKITALLDDQHASVVCAAVSIVTKFAQKHRNTYKPLAPRLSSILRIIASERLSEEYNYHNVPAPWFQMRLLRLIAELVYDDATLSEQVLPDVLFALEKAQAGVDAALGITYECIRTLTRLALPATLYINSAARPFDVPTRLLRSRNANLRCLGLCILGEIVRVEPGQAEEHQQVLVGCLDASDVNLRRLTLNLLYEITTCHNVAVVADKMLESIHACSSMRDAWWRERLAGRTVELALKLSPSATWFATTIVRVLQQLSQRNERLPDKLFERIMSFIGQDVSLDNYTMGETLKTTCANLLTKTLEDSININEQQQQQQLSINPNQNEQLIQLAVWVIGEYRVIEGSTTYNRVVTTLVDLFNHVKNSSLQCQILLGISKIQSRVPEDNLLASVKDIIETSKTASSAELRNMAIELSKLYEQHHLLTTVFPENAFFDYLDMEALLSPIHAQAKQARHEGASEFDATLIIKTEQELNEITVSSIRTEAYQPPQWPSDTVNNRVARRTHQRQASSQSGWTGTANQMNSMILPDDQMWQSATLSPYRPRRYSKHQSPSKTHYWTRHGYSAVTTKETPINSHIDSIDTNTHTNVDTDTPLTSIPDVSPSSSLLPIMDAELLREQQELVAALFYKPH